MTTNHSQKKPNQLHYLSNYQSLLDSHAIFKTTATVQ